MTDGNTPHEPGTPTPVPDLRDRAEQALLADASVASPEVDPRTRRLIHELEVHQIELEMQNEELHRARRDLEYAVHRLSDLYDFAPIGYLSLDRAGVITQANIVAGHLLEMDRSSLMGRHFVDSIAGDGRQDFGLMLMDMFEGDTPECTDTIELAGTPPKILQISGRRSNDRQECRLVMIDMTEQLQREEHRRDTQLRQQQQIFEQFTDPAWLIDIGDGDGDAYVITSVNEAFVRFFGHARDEVIGRRYFDVLPDRSDGLTRTKFTKAIATGHALRFERTAETEGGLQVAEVRVVPLLDDSGRCFQLLCSAHDLTQERRATHELELERERHLERLSILEKFQKVTVGRELKMIALKEEIERLRSELTQVHGAGDTGPGR